MLLILLTLLSTLKRFETCGFSRKKIRQRYEYFHNFLVKIKTFLTLDDTNVDDDDGTAAAVDAGDDRLLCA